METYLSRCGLDSYPPPAQLNMQASKRALVATPARKRSLSATRDAHAFAPTIRLQHHTMPCYGGSLIQQCYYASWVDRAVGLGPDCSNMLSGQIPCAKLSRAPG